MKKLKVLITIAALSAALGYAGAQGTIHSIELPTVHIELKAGEGKEKTESLCSICHSLDYITMQPRFQRAQWAATVNKMIKVMGAPINEEDAKMIISYLTANYGTGH
jgi:cytochrome c5